MGTQELRGSKLIGADVKSASGETLGKIEDVLINPMSGRIDFAVLAYQGSAPASPGATATSPSASGKLLPLPWSYLRASGLGSGATASSEQISFVFAGDKSKLENAPSFDQSNWPDVTQPEWRQRIFSHYGMPGIGTSTGGATTPGGTGTSSSSPPAGTPPQNPRPGSPIPQK
jgi:sporulation protein YlmC with PRC-barrel domain